MESDWKAKVLEPWDPEAYRRQYEEAKQRVEGLRLPTDFGGLENPYLEIAIELGGPSIYDPWGSAFGDAFGIARTKLVMHFAWAIPDERALELIGETGKVVDIGAGGGYWASLLHNRGVEVHPYDPEPGQSAQSAYLWRRVDRGTAEAAADHPDCTLFLCWPSYEASFASEALDRYTDAGGTRVAYVGEYEGGCCADDEFFRTLGRQYREIEASHIPQYPGIHDYLTIWTRR